MKKKFYFLMIALWSAITLTAQTPQTFTYQAVVRDNHGLVCNRTVGVQLTILQGSEEGTAVYTDRQTVRTNANGLFTVLIGTEGNSISGIDWGQGPYFLKSEVDPAGGTQYSLTTVQQMFSVPYALRAHVVDSIIGGVQYTETDPLFSAWSKDYNDLTNKPVIPTVPANVSAFTNDAGYLTSYTETDPAFSAWTKDYNDLTNKPQLFSGDYDSLSNLPHLFPWDYDSLLNKPTTIAWDSVTGKPQLFSGDYNDLANKPHLFSGDYDSLINKPTTIEWDSVTNKPTTIEWDSVTNKPTTIEWDSVTDKPTTIEWDSVTNKPTTIEWNNVTNKPTTIEWDSVTNKPTTIEWDSVTNKPTNVSAFNNDAGYLTAADLADIYSQLTRLAAIIDSLGDTLAARTHRYDSVIAHQQHLIDSMHCLVPIYGDTTATACGSFTWHDSVYTETPTTAPTFTYISAAGCDSIVTLHLTVSYANTGDTTATACESFTWHDITYTETPTTAPTFTFTTSTGCDSTVTLNLTILAPTYGDTSAMEYESFTWRDSTYTVTPAIAPTDTLTNAYGCDSIVTLHLTILTYPFDSNGATLSTFSVSATSQIRFSRGNLQYNAAQDNWRFAERQYDYMDTNNANASSTYDEWIDLFCFGTSGWNSGATSYQPWNHTANGTEYINADLTGTNANADWAVYNAITNGGNQAGLWRTLTIEEWTYLISSRPVSMRYAKIMIEDTLGYVLFPDTYVQPDGVPAPAIINSASGAPTTYTLVQWQQMESAGCVFLPAAGVLINGTLQNTNEIGNYWSSSYYGDEGGVKKGYDLIGFNNIFTTDDHVSVTQGLSVRPVMNYSPETSCITTYGDTTVCAVDTYTWNDITYTDTPSIAPTDTLTNAAGCDSIVTLNLTIIHPVTPFDANGATMSYFSVSSTHQVRFSCGNLQYNASQGTHATNDGSTVQGTWRFAEHQWDTVGATNVNTSSSYNGWVDVFCWGTSGWNSGANCWQPWSISVDNTDFHPGGSYTNSLTGSYANADWAVYNAISNGGNIPGTWRTLTYDELHYLFNTRASSTVAGTENARFVKAKVNGIHGVIIFPDTYTHPSDVASPAAINSTDNTGWNSNDYTACDWVSLEAAGCVFLPAAGTRTGTNAISSVNIYGEYWTSTHENLHRVYILTFSDTECSSFYCGTRHKARCVRPVLD